MIRAALLLAPLVLLSAASPGRGPRNPYYVAKARAGWTLKLFYKPTPRSWFVFTETSTRIHAKTRWSGPLGDPEVRPHSVRYSGVMSSDDGVVGGIMETTERPFVITISDTPCGISKHGKPTSSATITSPGSDFSDGTACGGLMPLIRQ